MTYMLILTVTILLSFYFYIIGYGTRLLLKIQMNHNLVLGMFTYGIVFSVFTMPLALLHVPWFMFFSIVTILNILLIIFAAYLMYREKSWPHWSFNKIFQYIKMYWPVIVLIILYFIIYLMNDYNFVWYGDHGAVWDNSYYASKANAAINSAQILQINPKYGYAESPVTIIVNSTVTWELFWSYLSALTGLTINQVSKLILPLFIYIGIFFSYDAILKSLFTDKKETKSYRGYIAVFVAYILYTTVSGNLQGELKKLLYFPWYGNVQITIMFLLTTFYFFNQALKEKKWIGVLILQIFFYSMFSAGAAMYAGLTYPFFMIYWLFKKNYTFKYDKVLVMIGLIGFLGINIFYIRSQAEVPFIEQEVWIQHLNLSMPIFLCAAAGVAVLFFRKMLTKSEQFFIFFIVISIAILLLGPTSAKVFLWYRFALHRYGVSLMFVFLIFGACGIFQMWKLDKKTFIILLLPGLILMQKNYDFFLQVNRYQLKPAHIFNVNRESDAVVDIARFLNEKAREKQKPIYYCMFSNNTAIVPTLAHQFNTNYPGRFLNIGSMILTETRNVYEATKKTNENYGLYDVDQFVESDCNYVITDSTGLKNSYVADGATIDHITPKSDLLAHDIYIINIENL